jgi:SpoIIAA-like
MGTPQSGERAFLVLERHGAQPKFDVVTIAAELARLRAGMALRILFDWSQVRSWQYAVPSAAAVREWRKIIPGISRAAFVHDPKWNRHAAMLSALLRVGNAQARSFHPTELDRAIEWLESVPQDVQLH